MNYTIHVSKAEKIWDCEAEQFDGVKVPPKACNWIRAMDQQPGAVAGWRYRAATLGRHQGQAGHLPLGDP